jgi:hypothetical protein
MREYELEYASEQGRSRPLAGGHQRQSGRPAEGTSQVIADFMVRVLEDERERTETRMQAATGLADRGFGKPTQPQAVELSAYPGFDPDEVKKGAERFTAEIRRLSEIRRRSAAASETA